MNTLYPRVSNTARPAPWLINGWIEIPYLITILKTSCRGKTKVVALVFRRIKLLLGSKLARNQARPELYFGTSSTTCKAEHENERHHAIPY